MLLLFTMLMIKSLWKLGCWCMGIFCSITIFSRKGQYSKLYEMKEELKKKLKKYHNFGKNKEKRQISILQLIVPVMLHTMNCIRRHKNITTFQNQGKHTWLHFMAKRLKLALKI